MKGRITVCLALSVLLMTVPAQAEEDQLGQLLEDRKLPAAGSPETGLPVPAPAPALAPADSAPVVRPRPSLLLPPDPAQSPGSGAEGGAVRNSRSPLDPLAPSGAEVDTTGLWFLIRQGDLTTARADLRRLRQQYPTWFPPPDLLAALQPVAPVTGPVASVAPADPAAGAEARGWQALAAGQPEQARDWFRRAGTARSARDGLGRALVALDDAVAVRHLVAADPTLAAGLAGAALGRALEGIDRGDALSLSDSRLTLAADLGRPDGWEIAGWRWLAQNVPDPAAAAFSRVTDSENARFGQVLAERARGRTAVAEDLACTGRALSTRLAGACADALSERQLARYQAGDYAAVLALSEQIGQTAPGRRGPQELRAWSLLRLDRPGEAADLFSQLYADTPTPGLATALAQSLTAAGRGAELRQRAQAGDRLFARIVQAQGAAAAWGRKQFDLAARHAEALSSDHLQ